MSTYVSIRVLDTVHSIPILLNPYTFLSGYDFRPHASGESDLRIRVNPLSIVESFESDIFIRYMWTVESGYFRIR